MKFKNKILKIAPYLLFTILIGATIVYATPVNKLIPPTSPSNTMYSLTDIYNLATDGTPAEEGTGIIPETPETLEPTGVTLTDVYNAVATAIENGGGTPDLTWQDTPGPNLCWSNNEYEINNGCTVGNGFITTPYENTTLGATEYCQYLSQDGTTLADTPQNIWHLPTIQEYQSITDYTLYNNATTVPGFAEDTNYWSGTEVAGNPSVAWYWNSWYGSMDTNGKGGQDAVRCARLASL